MPNNNKKEYLIKCPDCGIERMIVRRFLWFKKKTNSKLKCFRCSRYKKNQTNSGGFKKGSQIGERHRFKKGQFKNEKHPNWKGDKVGYYGIHSWIKENWGKANQCVNKRCRKKSLNYDWANVSGEYKRKKEDWLMLCRSCHMKWDWFRKIFDLGMDKKIKELNK